MPESNVTPITKMLPPDRARDFCDMQRRLIGLLAQLRCGSIVLDNSTDVARSEDLSAACNLVRSVRDDLDALYDDLDAWGIAHRVTHHDPAIPASM